MKADEITTLESLRTALLRHDLRQTWTLVLVGLVAVLAIAVGVLGFVALHAGTDATEAVKRGDAAIDQAKAAIEVNRGLIEAQEMDRLADEARAAAQAVTACRSGNAIRANIAEAIADTVRTGNENLISVAAAAQQASGRVLTPEEEAQRAAFTEQFLAGGVPDLTGIRDERDCDGNGTVDPADFPETPA